MLRIEIDIPRPLEALSLLAVTAGVILWMSWGSDRTVRAGEGGMDRGERLQVLKRAEDDARRIRAEQAVLTRREEILRYQLNMVEAQGGGETVERARQELLRLLSDQRAAEERFRATLREMWEAEGFSAAAAIGFPGAVAVQWPIEPDDGLSAVFDDAAYEQRFGLSHRAIDIPAPQGSAVRAAADGAVSKVVENGLGYSYIIVQHEGFATLYGHVSEALVREGDTVRQGDALARSGGMPGTPGAGALTTGPHLHFEVIVDGERVDPVAYLPARALTEALDR